MNDTVAVAGLHVHARMKPSVAADAIGRGLSLAACMAVLVTVHGWFESSWLVSLLALAGFMVAAWRIMTRPAARPRYSGVSIDAGGNWALLDATGWSHFSPRHISMSTLGWLSLRGERRPVQPGVGAAARPVVCRVDIWFDSVGRADWRRIKVASVWLMQRQQGLLVPASAADPRLRVPS